VNRIDQLLELMDKLPCALIPWSNRSAAHRRPLITGWQKANPSRETVIGWCKCYPLADWALVPKQDLVVVDLDRKNGNDGYEHLQKVAFGMMSQQGVRSATPEQLHYVAKSFSTMGTHTFSGGLHLYYRLTSNTNLPTYNFGKGIETKRLNASVHVPPSEGYNFLSGIWEYDEIPMMPDWMLSFFSHQIKDAPKRTYAVPRYSQGERRKNICSMAGALRNIGLTEPELIASLLAVRSTRCDGDFPDSEVIAIAKDYATKEVGTAGLALLGDQTAASAIAFCERSRK